MMLFNFIIGLFFLVLLSVIDLKTINKRNGYIPSVLTTFFLIFAVLVGDLNSIYLGVLASVIALLLTDMMFWDGLADLKTFIAASMLFGNMIEVLIFAVLFGILGTIFKAAFLKIVKKKDAIVPLIPIMAVAFLLEVLFIKNISSWILSLF